LNDYAKDKLEEEYRPASINRIFQTFRRALNLAHRGTPSRIARVPKFELLDESDNVCQDNFSETELTAIIGHLPVDLQDFTRWCAACAMRKGEASKLTWAMLDESKDPARLSIPARICKHKKDRVLPIVGELANIIERRKAARPFEKNGVTRMSEFVFHRGGVSIYEFRKSWKTACTKAGCVHRFHSTRRFAVTNMIESGLSPVIAMKWSGHKTQKMLERYGIIKPDTLAEGFTQTELHRAKEQQKEKAKAEAQGARVVAIK